MLLRTIKILTSIFLILLGILGLFLPILPGWGLIIAGAILIDPANKDKLTRWLKNLKLKIKKGK